MPIHSAKVLHYKVHVNWTKLMLQCLPLLFVQHFTLERWTTNRKIEYAL